MLRTVANCEKTLQTKRVERMKVLGVEYHSDGAEQPDEKVRRRMVISHEQLLVEGLFWIRFVRVLAGRSRLPRHEPRRLLSQRRLLRP